MNCIQKVLDESGIGVIVLGTKCKIGMIEQYLKKNAVDVSRSVLLEELESNKKFFSENAHRSFIIHEEEQDEVETFLGSGNAEKVYFFNHHHESLNNYYLGRDVNEEKIRLWMQGVPAEIAFWRRCMREHRNHMMKRGISGFPYQDLLSKYQNPRILDCGAGPITVHGSKKVQEYSLEACDPLAYLYAYALKMNNIVPEVATVFSYVEKLSNRYAMNSFDIIVMRNALDHCFEPIIGILEMIKCVKDGGTIRLSHVENEAENVDYNGLHQWNLSELNGALLIWSKGKIVNVNRLLNDNVDMIVKKEKDIEGRTWIVVDIIKRKSINTMDYPERVVLKELDEALLNFFFDIRLNEILKKHKNIEGKILEFCRVQKNIFIYGAGEIGKVIAAYLMSKNVKIKAFVVSDGQSKEDCVLEIPVVHFSDAELQNCGVIIGVNEKHKAEIKESIGNIDHVFYLTNQNDWEEFIAE